MVGNIAIATTYPQSQKEIIFRKNASNPILPLQVGFVFNLIKQASPQPSQH
jgi:hypothetical protein